MPDVFETLLFIGRTGKFLQVGEADALIIISQRYSLIVNKASEKKITTVTTPFSDDKYRHFLIRYDFKKFFYQNMK